jgi:hypothetical protein
MYNDRFRISLRAANGNYYSAVQATDNTWTVTNGVSAAYIKYLPKGWDETDITWERNMTYYGVFRSQTQKFQFSEDARAILLSILADKGVNGYCRMTIDIYNESTLLFETFYTSQIDLSGAKDSKRTQLMVVATLDSELYELLKSKAQSEFNIPFWVYDEVGLDWEAAPNTIWVHHTGIKSIWRVNLQGAESPTAVLPYVVRGFNGGRTGALPVDEGMHTIPALQNYVIVQANGTTTYIGNDILETVIKSSTQGPIYNEVSFLDNGNINTSGQYPIKPLIPSVQMIFELNGKIDGDINFTTGGGASFTLRFVLFEITESGEPTRTGGRYDIYHTLYTYSLGSSSPYTPPSSGVFSANDLVGLNPFKAYVLGIIFDDTTNSQDSSGDASFLMSDLRLSVYSNSNSGTSTPVLAPKLPPSTFPAFRPKDLGQKILDVIDSVETNAYGFPIPLGTGYVFESDFLSDNAVSRSANFDLVPFRTAETSENAIRDINGITYITKSLANLFQQWNKINMMGLGIISDNTIKMEQLDYFFDDSTLILNLGTNVADFEIMPFTEPMGNVLNAGYEALQANKNFATDAFCMPMKWELPLNKTPKQLDYQVTEVNTDMYYIEKARAQNNSDNSSPSASNGCVLLQITDGTGDARVVRNPSGDNFTTPAAYSPETYATAQSTNPATANYLKGLYYPDTAINTALDPASNIYRNAKYIRSLCDGQDDFGSVMSFRKIYQQQYNDPSLPALERAGMSKKINTSTVINQVEDIPLTTTSKLFRPYIFQVTSEYPVNMYSIINANPYGYVSFKWRGEDFTDTEYKGFLLEVKQSAANNKATVFKLLAHPSTTDADLKKN